MKIATQLDVDAVNARFNGFHDGFMKQIVVASGGEFLTQMPWEDKRQFASNEEELLATSLVTPAPEVLSLELHIRHYNYDWPNQPRNRSIMVSASPAKIFEHLLSFIGCAIFDITFKKDLAGITCLLTHHTVEAGLVRTMENGITTVLFSAEDVTIAETEWTEVETR